MTRAADPLPAAIRISPLTLTMMAREVITERGPHPRSLRRESAACRVWISIEKIGLSRSKAADHPFWRSGCFNSA
jgi:hypothetical protein